MIEALIAIVEAVVAVLVAIVEALAGLLGVSAEGVGFGAALAVVFVGIAELFWWLVLWVVELLVALFRWRKPRKVFRPIFWRPKKKTDQSSVGQNHS